MVRYTKHFYESMRSGSRSSAEEIVPIVMDLVHPTSVLDVGCGVGTWLSEFRKAGVEEILGIDGDYVDRSMLQIPGEFFIPMELKNGFDLGRSFDLVVSLEVAEHIPEKFMEDYLDSLLRHGSVILFSAAIPYQGGMHHVNEQWPEYWNDLFIRKGCLAVDAIRKRIWRNEKVEFWYRQNILIFSKRDQIEKNDALKAEREITNETQLALVHPAQYLYNCRPTMKNMVRMVSGLMRDRGKRE